MDTNTSQTEAILEIKEKFDVDRANTEAILGWLTESEEIQFLREEVKRLQEEVRQKVQGGKDVKISE